MDLDDDEEYEDDFTVDSPSNHSLEPEVLKHDVTKRTRSKATPNKVSDLKGANGYSWEDQYQRSWDIVKDDDDTRSLESIIQKMIENRKKKIMKNPTTPFQRGIIRTLIVIVDGSSIMSEKDLRPTRFAKTISLLQEFTVEFFDQNPISQMGILLMRNGVSQLVSEVSGLPQYHLDKIRQMQARQHNRYEPKGDPSLQNSLEMARSLLKYNFGNSSNDSRNSKEILLVFGALFTSDPSDIHKTIQHLVDDEIKVRVIGLSAQVAICQELVNKTNHQQRNIMSQNYGVILNEVHFKELLMECVIPVPITSQKDHPAEEVHGIPLIKMGFPSKIQANVTLNNLNFVIEFPLLSASDPANGLDEMKVVDLQDDIKNPIAYQCPQCKNKVLNLPTVCPVCGLMLILSTHLARSYHHLVPLAPYREVPASRKYDSTHCYGCLLLFPEGKEGDLEGVVSSRYRCLQCKEDFCIDCDVFVHEVLHNCPGCEQRVEKSTSTVAK